MSESDRDGGRTDIYAPDSDWDADLATQKNYEVYDGIVIPIAVNDWIDVQEGALALDPLWGSSFQVYETQENALIIRYYNSNEDLYELTTVDPQYIYNSYRRAKAVE